MRLRLTILLAVLLVALGATGTASALTPVATAPVLPFATATPVTLIGNPVVPQYWTLNLGLGERVRLDVDAKLAPTVTVDVFRPGVTDATIATAKPFTTITAANTVTPARKAIFADTPGRWVIRATATASTPFTLSATQLSPASQVGATDFSSTITKAAELAPLAAAAGTTFDAAATGLVSPRYMRVQTANGDRVKLQVTGTNDVPLKVDVFDPAVTDATVAATTPITSTSVLAGGAVTNISFTTPAGGSYIVRISSLVAQPGTFTVLLADVAPPSMQPACAADRTNIGRVTIKGCVENAGVGLYKATGVISFSGIEIAPVDGAKMTINATTLEITSKGKFTASLWNGQIPIAYHQSYVDLGGLKHEFNLLNEKTSSTSTYTTADGKVDWKQVGADVFAGSSNIAGPDVGGMPLTGKLTIQFQPDNGGQVAVDGNVAIPGWSGVTGTLGFASSVDKPIVRAAIAFGAENTGGLTFNANLGYSEEPVNAVRIAIWSAGFKVDMGSAVPPAKVGGAEGAIEFRDGSLAFLRAAVNTNIAIGATGMFLTRAGFGLRIKPYFQITGIAGVAVGPQVGGVSVAEIAGEGGFADGGRCPLSQVDAARWFFDGQASIASWFTVANFGVCAQVAESPFITVYTRGGFSAAGLLEGNANLTGYIDGSRAWMLEGNANLAILGGLKVNGSLVLSDYGVAACGRIRAFFFSLQVGVERRWSDGAGDASWACPDFGPYRTVANAKRLRAAGEFPVVVPAGDAQVNIEVVGANGQVPGVDVVDPSGKVLASSTSISEITRNAGIFVPRPETGEMWIAVPTATAGTYMVRAQAGSTIETIRTSLPEPKVAITATARVRGTKVRVDYAIANLNGRSVRFWEIGDGLARRIGVVRRAKGSITFTRGFSDRALHRIVAVVYNNGEASPSQVVARFRTPPPAAPATPTGVRAVYRDGRVTIRWNRAPGALGYAIGMVDTDGHVVRATVRGTTYAYRPTSHGNAYVLVKSIGHGELQSRAAHATVSH